MLLGIVVLTVVIYPSVHGQSVVFDQECHILQTLELLETRLQEQDSRLKLLQTPLEQQKSLLEKQAIRLDQQEARLEQQNATIEKQTTRLEEQDAFLGQQNATIEKQTTRLEEQDAFSWATNATIEKQTTRLEEQDAFLGQQTATIEKLTTRLGEQDAFLGQQNASLVEQEKRLEQQQARVRELENQFTVFNQSTNDKMIGFSVHTPRDADKSFVIRFTTVVTNEGSGYNTSTGDFTCIVPGFYHFSVHVIKRSLSSVSIAYCHIYRNNSYVAFAVTKPVSTADGSAYSASTSVILHLAAGDVVYPGSCTPASTMYDWTSFSGFLIRAD